MDSTELYIVTDIINTYEQILKILDFNADSSEVLSMLDDRTMKSTKALGLTWKGGEVS